MRILSLAPLDGPGLRALEALGEVELDPWTAHVPVKLHAPAELAARARDVDLLVVEADFIPREVFEGTSLRYLGVCRGDPNNVDITAATEHGVAVIRTPGRNAGAVADLTIGLMFCVLRSIVAADGDVRAGRWVVDGKLAQQRYVGRELSSCVVGLVGFGAVGRAVAQRLRALGSSVLAYDPFADAASSSALQVEQVSDLGDLMARADIVSIHAPLSEATRGLVGAEHFERLRPGSYLVNTARYGVVAEEPMLQALRDGRLAAAAFDHFENEFLLPDHPLVTMPNVVLTPHIGGTTVETVRTHSQQIADAVAALLRGEVPAEVVNPEALGAARA